jgi:hypothetical protein
MSNDPRETKWIQNSILYNALFALGDIIELDFNIDYKKCREELIQWDHSWQQYNPSYTNNPRFGLAYTSLDGEVFDPVGLDSIRNYNQKHDTKYTEEDFDKHTAVSDSVTSLQQVKDFFGKNIRRSHFLKLDRSGHFPKHRDSLTFLNFRVIVPISFDSSNHYFLLDEKPVQFENGRVYIVNTIKNHCLFSCNDSMILFVLNISLDQEVLYKCIRVTKIK